MTVSVRETGLRDGLQMVATILPTETKIAWCRAQAASGFAEMEVTSFVPPSILPQYADASDVLAAANAVGGLLASVLVPNLKGAMRAMDRGARKINFVLSASESHNRSNVRKSTEDSLADLREILAERETRGQTHSTAIGCGLATSFGCSFEGAVPVSRVASLAAQIAEAGVDEVNLADTVGYATPLQVREIIAAVRGETGDTPLAAHFHDTRGLGLANVVAAAEAGIRRFDASLGGLGGCPFAPGATGNIATEDAVYLLESLGLPTGIDLGALLAVRTQLDGWMQGERLEGRLSKAGPAKSFQRALGETR